MAELSRINAEGKVIKIGDKEYTLSPLRIKELSVLEKWAEDTILEQAEKKIAILKKSGMDFTSEAIVSIVDKAITDSKITHFREKELESINGAKLGIKLSLQIKHGHMEDAELEKIIEEIGLDNMQDIVTSLSYTNEEENKQLKKN